MKLKGVSNKFQFPLLIRVLLVSVLCGVVFLSLPVQMYAVPKAFDYKGDVRRVAGEITVTLNSAAYKIKPVENGAELIHMEGFGLTSSPGDPQIPFKIYDVAMPPNIDWKTVQISLVAKETEIIPGKHTIQPAPPLQPATDQKDLVDWGEGKLIVDSRNLKVYKQNALFPQETVSIVTQSQMRKWRFVRLGFYPVQYNPVDGTLKLNKSVTVKLSFKRIGTRVFLTDPLLRDKAMDEEAKFRFTNFEQALSWYNMKPTDDLRPVPAVADYVIITTNAIKAGSTQLVNFVNHKISEGHTVRVVTESDYSHAAGSTTADKIRQWLTDNYIALGIKWVLLIGNPHPTTGDVPMKMMWPRWSLPTYRESPTDYYYANLTGNWDLDGDGFYGEDRASTSPNTPDPAINPGTYSVRWTGKIEATTAGIYSFSTFSDEGVRVQINGTNVINNWAAHTPTTNTGSINLTAGQHTLQIDYFNNVHGGVINFSWLEPGADKYVTVPSDKLYHLVDGSYVAGGLDGAYYNNTNFTGLALNRVDRTVDFNWSSGDKGPGGVDFTPDLYVGRIPVYAADYATLDTILQKIINYESVTTIPAWRRNILFGIAYLWDPCSDWQMGEAIINDYAKKLRFGYYRHYEELTGATPECSPVIGHPPTAPPHPPNPDPASLDNMLKEWVNNNAHPGYGIVVWSTHGSTQNASGLMSSALCTHLNDNQPVFTFQGSCLNGYPEDPNNLGYALLKRGAIGTVSASRVSWNACFVPPANPNSGSNCNLTYHYVKRLMNGDCAARALYRTMDDVNPDSSWMNKMDYNLYGDPTASLLKPFIINNVDVIPVLDHSGSMSGYTSTSLTDRKIDVLKAAAAQFVDMLDTDAGNHFGLVKFSTTATTAMPLQPFNAAAKTAAHSAIAGITATSLTSIGAGLSRAVTEFTTRGGTGHRRCILLVTDGQENTAPMIASIQPSLIANQISVYALGLGYSWGVDEDRLINLANATGGDYRITDDDLIFRKYFIELLGSAADWSVITDPVLLLSAGQKQTVPVSICSGDTEVVFTTYWSGADDAVRFTLQSPDGQLYTAAAPAYTAKKRYSFYRFDLTKLPAAQRNGTWLMNLEALKPVRLSASALARTETKMRISLDKSFIYSGEKVLFQIQLLDKDRPIKGATVKVTYSRPAKSFGNIMKANPVNLKTLQLTVPERSAIKPLQAKVSYLKTKLGKDFMAKDTGEFTFYDDGTHGDLRANDGIYSATFAKTEIPGSYAFRIVATNMLVDGIKTTREWSKYFVNKVAAAPQYSVMDVKLKSITKNGRIYSVNVAPRDQFGNYLGPGGNVTVRMASQGAKTKAVLNDNLDGTYSVDVLVTPQELASNANLTIQIDGKEFSSIKLP